MTDETKDYRDTVFLPKTDFPMKAGLAQKEPAILERWARIGIYQKLREARAGAERFILHDGPPYANGDLHMGHALNKILKDLVVRSQTLLGKDAPYVPGWDCHGLPIEWKVEEQYRKKKLNKDEIDPVAFRAECRAYAQKWVDVQRDQFQRLGVIGDWADPYLTMKFESEAIIAGELLKFAERGQLYRGAKPVMWSPVEKTALAEAEVEYEDITSTQIDVAFEITEAPNAPELQKLIDAGESVSAVIWTTTPWTIPVNQALAYGADIEYVLLEIPFIGAKWDASIQRTRPNIPKQRLLVAKNLAGITLKRIYGGERFASLDVLEVASILGKHLSGATARHPICNFLRHSRESGNPVGEADDALGPRVRGDDRVNDSALAFYAKPRPFLDGSHFVTTDAGTGLVHMAPDHGEDDFLLCKANGIDPVFAVTDDGKYRDDWAWLGGQGSVINKKFVASDGPICTDLCEAGALLAASDDFTHSYPHSWRSKAKIIFRCTPQWFIPMDAPLDQPLPERVREGHAVGEDIAEATGMHVNEDASTPASAAVNHNGATLRGTALDAIENTRWVPERSKNRIRSMVEGRPDWVISRQRAWGVPIPLYVHRTSGDYLRDEGVNGRILDAFREGGADAWFAADHQALLGADYDLAEYEPVTDILDVWFDSGSTHAFVIEARYGEDVRADLYLEGSDQHRGWFQSSLLESSGTRGRAPYDAVLTHGFALDKNGRKMSKSVGNVVDPLKIMEQSGADILRLWVASTDYFEDVRISDEVLKGTGDAYRKLRNTFRYMLGALEGFSDAEKVAVADMPELERYILARLGELDVELRGAIDALQFHRYARALTEFANEDLSAFFFDIRKDCLYCDGEDSERRRAYRTVLDLLFHALVRYAAPILVFTTEEVWQTRFPSEDGSVHFETWPELPPLPGDDALTTNWADVRALRERVTEAIEPLRREKVIRSSNEAEIWVPEMPLPADHLSEIFISSTVHRGEGEIRVERTDKHKCGRCWRHLPEVAVDGALCDRCAEVVES